ncbi:alpha/beta hydrolase [Streptomyces albus subsp. chlorinus]|uniref:alpha/beta fold hydrolase n=1 Tax=Streptomyces albus TaxID=1888 RepID=UPI00156F9600|nr:alpha/beta hydrolase [Streptomyces albus]NSC23535.1 alpha/beta hydrolase [Streptomyces albus subsp. chlorinus]
MVQRALPVREPRLGRPRGAVGQAPHAVVLVLPGGGTVGGGRRGSVLAAASAVPLARRLGNATSRDDPLVAHIVRYRSRGWAGSAVDPAQDAEWAVEEVVRRYGDVPVCLVGADVGGRAALRAAGHPAVVSVVALGPCLEEADARPDGAGGAETGQTGQTGQTGEAGEQGDGGDTVRRLRGRHVLLVHGTADTTTDPELSYRFAERAKKVNAQVCRFEVHTDGHGLRGYAFEVACLTRDFVLGTLCARDFSRPLADAFAAPPPLGLRMPLASGFGRNLP